MIADQINALNRAREVAAASVANLMKMASETREKSTEETSTAPAPPTPSAASQQQQKRISFSVDSLLSDVHQRHAADLSVRTPPTPPTLRPASSGSSDGKSFDGADSDTSLVDDEDVDIEDDGDASETSTPTLPGHHHHQHALSVPFSLGSHMSSVAAHHHAASLGAHLNPALANLSHLAPNLAMQMRGPGMAAPPGWPLPYGLAAAAWAQHASQFVNSKFLKLFSSVFRIAFFLLSIIHWISSSLPIGLDCVTSLKPIFCLFCVDIY